MDDSETSRSQWLDKLRSLRGQAFDRERMELRAPAGFASPPMLDRTERETVEEIRRVRPLPAAKVLLIDDDAAVLEVTTSMLERAGMKVLSASDGRSAAATFRMSSADIDLVMLDINMPGLDGAATCEKLRSLRPDVPVLFCSGGRQTGGATRIAGLRAAGFLQKPFTFDTLNAKVAEALRNSSLTPLPLETEGTEPSR